MPILEQPPDFDRLKERITKRVGFDCALYSSSFISRRVDVRLRALGIQSYAEYAQRLESAEECAALQKELTIHTTNFFRDMPAWQAVQNELLPALIERKRRSNDQQIRIWCAGCSTGEEPLTIAICLYETLGERLGGFKVSILGTDLDADTIERAKEATYDNIQFKEMPPSLRDKYFQQVSHGYVAAQRLLSLITYRAEDIFKSKNKGFDIILCRNTVIYFDQVSKLRVYVDMYAALNTYGFFVMGKTETLLGPARERFTPFNSAERMFVKDEKHANIL